MELQINDILYTKDGRKTGNLTVVDVTTHTYTYGTLVVYTCISDYGNIVRSTSMRFVDGKQFFKTTGRATEGHKYFNYKQNHPEFFI